MATKYAFIAEWLDPGTGYLWKYQLFFFAETNEVEMTDIKNNRMFLKRIRYDGVTLPQLYLGNTIMVYSRQLKITEYGDDFTRSRLEAKAERTLAMIKPDAIQHMGKIVHAVQKAGFTIGALRMCQLSASEARAFYHEHAGRPYFDRLVAFVSSGRVLAMELVAPGAIARWRALLGPTDSNQARAEAPNSIRAHFGTDKSFNAAHGSDAPHTAAAELDFFFGAGRGTVGRCALCRGTTLAILKPSTLRDGVAGLALDFIMDRFSVTAAQMVSLTHITAGELMEVYKGVLAPGELSAMLEEVTSGPCLALEVADKSGAPSSDVVGRFRELVGPVDPDVGRVLRPKCLRAMFGADKVRNGVHCTDLPEDGELEVSYIFSVLAK